MTLVQKAKTFAAYKHRHQTRKYDGTAYTAHLDSVTTILERHGVTAKVVLAAAYLHDTSRKPIPTLANSSMFSALMLRSSSIGSRTMSPAIEK
ncbi:HD domain-containing protein [Hyphomicrobium sp.]|uniref:HD domain-containing protein n=1 Tax=Hyphomicrobium sp. TaxID=82 RepID=UPI002CD32AB6|nr:HD domain-containing protein [Hyphomicrobium sp.]HVZ05700.1 HD domain-containing protein [Hyphomicrobium sp.]